MSLLLACHLHGQLQIKDVDAVWLPPSGQVVLLDEEGAESPCLEWSAVEGMLSSLETGAEAYGAEASGDGLMLELSDERGRILGTSTSFGIAPSSGEQLLLMSADDALVFRLRAGQWWWEETGESLRALTIRAQTPATAPAPTPIGPRQRLSALAGRAGERLVRRATV